MSSSNPSRIAYPPLEAPPEIERAVSPPGSVRSASIVSSYRDPSSAQTDAYRNAQQLVNRSEARRKVKLLSLAAANNVADLRRPDVLQPAQHNVVTLSDPPPLAPSISRTESWNVDGNSPRLSSIAEKDTVQESHDELPITEKRWSYTTVAEIHKPSRTVTAATDSYHNATTFPQSEDAHEISEETPPSRTVSVSAASRTISVNSERFPKFSDVDESITEMPPPKAIKATPRFPKYGGVDESVAEIPPSKTISEAPPSRTTSISSDQPVIDAKKSEKPNKVAASEQNVIKQRSMTINVTPRYPKYGDADESVTEVPPSNAINVAPRFAKYGGVDESATEISPSKTINVSPRYPEYSDIDESVTEVPISKATGVAPPFPKYGGIDESVTEMSPSKVTNVAPPSRVTSISSDQPVIDVKKSEKLTKVSASEQNIIKQIPPNDLKIPASYQKAYAAMEKRRKPTDSKPKSDRTEYIKEKQATIPVGKLKEPEIEMEPVNMSIEKPKPITSLRNGAKNLYIEEANYRTEVLPTVVEDRYIPQINGFPENDKGSNSFFAPSDVESGIVKSPIEEILPLHAFRSENSSWSIPTLEPSRQLELAPAFSDEVRMSDIREQLDDLKAALSKLQKDNWQLGSRLALRQQPSMTGPQRPRPAFARNMSSIAGSRTSLISAGLSTRPTSPIPVGGSGSSVVKGSQPATKTENVFSNLFAEKVPKAQLDAQRIRNNELEKENQYLMAEMSRFKEQNISQIHLILSKLNVFRAKLFGEELTDLELAESGIDLIGNRQPIDGKNRMDPLRPDKRSKPPPSESAVYDILTDLKADRDKLAQNLESVQSRMDAERDMIMSLLSQVTDKVQGDSKVQRLTAANLEEIYKKMTSLERTQAILAENVWRH